MGKKLVIVESPTKVKTIKKFLGSNYEVAASQGHVRDLPKSSIGIDIENDYEPKYITIRGKGELLAQLRKQAKKADHIYLATDPDREGEAISWHLTKALSLENDKYDRITFNEITKNAVKASLKASRKIDMNLVDSQQTRRILDRVVGYGISPLLWAKVKRGLSAGRVQSATLHMIRKREDEINAFIPEEYFTVDVVLSDSKLGDISFAYYGEENNKTRLSDIKIVNTIIKDCKKGQFIIHSVKKGERIRKAPLPFTTSTLQQDSIKKLNFSVSKTMRIAQSLYEGKQVQGRGMMGLITYLRTDSTRISDEARASCSGFIMENYGDKYLKEKEEDKTSKKKVQDAHEAIRPADVNLTPDIVKSALSRDEFRLYSLIWKRFVASRMSNAVFDTAGVRVNCGTHYFNASTSVQSFDGYLRVYVDKEEESSPNKSIENLKENNEMKLSSIKEERHLTKPAAHFNEGSLVKAMEEAGIGRPSTYSPTISVLLKRHYIAIDEKNIFMTELGEVVDDIMGESFPDIVDINFTANMEGKLDLIEEGGLQWQEILRDFYPSLSDSIKKAEKELEKVNIEDEVTDVICENCGRNMVIKYGPHGKFLACPGFPECRNTKPYLEKIGVSCPKCGKDMVLRKTRKGRKFYGCENYPECDFTSWNLLVKKSCPNCGGYMVKKGKKIVCGDSECGYIEEALEE